MARNWERSCGILKTRGRDFGGILIAEDLAVHSCVTRRHALRRLSHGEARLAVTCEGSMSHSDAAPPLTLYPDPHSGQSPHLT